MSTKETIHVKNEESVLKKGQRDYLVFPSEYLVPGIITEQDDSFDLELNTEGLYPVAGISKSEAIEKYRLLIAIAKLKKLRADYTFSMDPENLMYDVNFMPKVKARDGSTGTESDDFINEYKALIGSIIKSNYNYHDFYQGGKDLYKKDKFLSKIADAEDIDQVTEALEQEYLVLQEKMGKDNIMVSSKKYKRTRRSIPVMLILIVVMVAALVWLFMFDIPTQDTQIAVSNQYVAEDYIGVLETLDETTLSNMTDETKYMAAISGVHTASLSDKQKEKVLEGISLKTDSLMLDYWIETGRGNYSEAVDIAKRLGNDELELYGLIIEKDSVEADMSLKGSRKTERLNSLEEEITALEEKLNPKAEDGGQ